MIPFNGFVPIRVDKKPEIRETVGNLGELSIREIPLERLVKPLRWIHEELTEEEFRPLLLDVVRRLHAFPELPPLEVMLGQSRKAAAYFTRLPGKVATLGGIRAEAGFERQATELIRHMTSKLQRAGIRQIQAVVVDGHQANEAIVRSASFKPLTSVQHLFLNPAHRNMPAHSVHVPRARWQPAHTLAKSRMARLISATFAQTLDCPTLNGLRGADDVLDGFLDGKAFRNPLPWYLLNIDSQPVGCVLLTQHPNQVVELSYMGLIPSARGQQLGGTLVEQAITRSQTLSASLLVVAVDKNNWPAIRLYNRYGFQHHRTLSVWLWDEQP